MEGAPGISWGEARGAEQPARHRTENYPAPKGFIHNPGLQPLLLTVGVFVGVLRLTGCNTAVTSALVTLRLHEMIGTHIQAYLLLNLGTSVKT